jgi:uncharacterized protein with PQ loop repeat
MLELIGWIGGIFLAICAVPQAIKTYREKDASGLSWLMLFFWAAGEVLTIYYIIITNIQSGQWQIPLIFNYGLNILLMIYLIGAKYYYSRNHRGESQNSLD